MRTRAVSASLPCQDCGKPRGRDRSRGRCAPCQADAVRARDRARLNPERNREKARAHYWANREKVLARMSTEEGRRYARERQRAKLATPEGRLYSNTGRAIRESLRGAKAGRKWETVVGYSLADLMAHLEKQFDRRMTWANMGEWEVDHIRPRCGFDLSNPDEFRQCWALTNLRPLWAKANRAKSGNRLHLI